ncbi:PREDICTED: phosphatidylinositol 4-phosphate 5-kinase 8 [Nelumbo nucifera]|uniref:1-phosphatidylinositol-4-phosphate 5-kinase n=1 Tax=Nelumbo nucifera TaxID=4432 RepID=A0A1U7Z5S7_NELNU|nr:PREDICTED: phosphatidylinositol 4-phosphate 5-kinase 8 [Nelumbo nucifera]
MEASERHMEKVFLNGDIYVGDFKGMLPHGTGKYTWSDGSIYEGEWEEGKMTGKGHFQWASGAAYEGDFSGGFLHGFGTFTGLDGSVYTGAWRMNVQNGVGNKKYCNSDIYEGSWKEGVRNGCGRYTWNAQNTYVGNWKDGKMCGRGVMNWENGDLFDGFWLDGLRHGSGFYRFADGGYYFGTWTRGQKDGPGTFYPAGSKLPSLTRWRSTAGYYDKIQTMLPHTSPVNLGELRDHKLGMKHSLSEKLSFGLVRGSGRISHRTISLDGAPSADDPLAEVPARDSFSTDEDQTVEQGSCNLVYEREYMQGVLISERVRNNEAEMTQKNKCELKGTKKSGETIFKGHRSYYLMLNLQLGIRYTVGKITPVPRREVRSSDFGPRARIRMYFPRKGSQLTPPHYSIGFYWKDYCPMVFRNLREMFKIDAADYMMSICGCDSLRELSSPGKSGSIFYLSQDERFFIKTLKESELKGLPPTAVPPHFPSADSAFLYGFTPGNHAQDSHLKWNTPTCVVNFFSNNFEMTKKKEHLQEKEEGLFVDEMSRGFLKLNFGGSIGNPGLSRIGGVLRNEGGNIVAMYSGSIDIGDSIKAEFLALCLEC